MERCMHDYVESRQISPLGTIAEVSQCAEGLQTKSYEVMVHNVPYEPKRYANRFKLKSPEIHRLEKQSRKARKDHKNALRHAQNLRRNNGTRDSASEEDAQTLYYTAHREWKKIHTRLRELRNMEFNRTWRLSFREDKLTCHAWHNWSVWKGRPTRHSVMSELHLNEPGSSPKIATSHTEKVDALHKVWFKKARTSTQKKSRACKTALHSYLEVHNIPLQWTSTRTRTQTTIESWTMSR
jgi:hypothetical protein